MKVQCKGCRIGFNVPDDKVPEGKVLKILCPKCKEPVEISQKTIPTKIDGRAPYLSETLEPEYDDDRVLDYTNAIDVVDEGMRTALLCATDVKLAEKIVRALQEVDFWVVHATRPGFALGKLHYNTYDLIVLEEDFDTDKNAKNLVLHHVQVLPMHQRRQFYLCLLTRDKPTLDANMAFRMGVNLILNVNDIEKAKVLFARAMKEYRSFYSLFNTELAKKW